MNIEILKSKIHRATITEADLNYIGSITIDEDLMQVYASLTLSTGGFIISSVNIAESIPQMSGDVTNGSLGGVASSEVDGVRRITSLYSNDIDWHSSLWS